MGWGSTCRRLFAPRKTRSELLVREDLLLLDYGTGGRSTGGGCEVSCFRRLETYTAATTAAKRIPPPADKPRTSTSASPEGRDSAAGGGGSTGAARNASTPPAFVSPGNAPFVSPATYTPDPPTAAALALSNPEEPNCRVPKRAPDASYFRRNASGPRAPPPPGKMPSVCPTT